MAYNDPLRKGIIMNKLNALYTKLSAQREEVLAGIAVYEVMSTSPNRYERIIAMNVLESLNLELDNINYDIRSLLRKCRRRMALKKLFSK